MAEKEIGVVSTYFTHVSVAAVKLSGKLKVGDRIKIKGHTTFYLMLIFSPSATNLYWLSTKINNESIEKTLATGSWSHTHDLLPH